MYKDNLKKKSRDICNRYWNQNRYF